MLARNIVKTLVFIIFVVIISSALGWRFWSPAPAAAEQRIPSTRVGLAQVKKQPYTYYLEAIGKLEAQRQVLVSAEVSGKVVDIDFESGDEVKAGQVLLTLNDAPEQGELVRLKGEFESARAQFARVQELAKTGAESRRAFDSARAQLDAAKGDMERMQAQIAQRHIRAPFAGTLGIRQAHLGQYLEAGGAVATLTDPGVLRVNFTLAERDGSRVELGQTVQAKVDAWADVKFQGKIVAVDPQINQSHTINVQAVITDTKKLLRPGMYARVSVTLPQTAELLIPETAITYNAYGESVFAVYLDEAGVTKVKRESIKVGERRDGWAVVNKGLTEGVQVVTSGQLKLHDGVAVEGVPDTIGLNLATGSKQ
ncbi:efflux RND transporter periplasmic adaptor subunit [Pseudomonas sp. ADAK2]|uniref:efflux RND transporter periplasmic adaptor subunit n=1 Tax=Pseudomonas TaxID=286 RepID=UPI00146449B9|nr:MULTISPECIES: efflux RND transporter periplasmic adaptor subunit [unclassified Pseudomonas]QJI42497.1 efflux RND transporter periplasmic adaptor subunit [Pseudomonas sp. ADAK7]QJI48800.1 efflux RND transporter periplasmic adaptor subunit [Pseudomonas sp. ADAK2]